jgi:hypothetical protein
VTESPIPRDAAAERAVLGSCMNAVDAHRAVTPVLTGLDFYEPRNALIWEHIGGCVQTHGIADPVLVADSLRTAGELGKAGGAEYLHTLYAEAPITLQAEGHAQIVADLATRRRLIQAAERMIQRAGSGAGDIADVLEDAASEVRGARDERAGVELLTRDSAVFMGGVLEEPDWIVPGLLARGDRLVLTGSGGLGKSTLLRMVSVCAAGGVPPFDWAKHDPFTPARVMVVDCENADHQLKTALWPLLRAVEGLGCPVEDRLTIGGHGNPLNLLDKASSMSLLRTVEHDKPDLVYIGPAYKLHNDDPDKEAVVKRITNVLDQIRATGAAVMTEAHHTKSAKVGGSLEPSGSNLWTWWPEIGRGLRLDPDSDPVVRRCALEPWRIDRVSRNYPQWIEHDGRFPWARSEPNPFYGVQYAKNVRTA